MADERFENLIDVSKTSEKSSTINAIERVREFVANLNSKDFNFDNYLRFSSNTGSMKKALSSTLYGINAFDTKPFIPLDKADRGLVFFTRPLLNLSNNNIICNANFVNLASKNHLSIFRYVRSVLDPRCSTDAIRQLLNVQQPIDPSPYLMNELAFIPVFTNSIKTLSGWPDPVLPTYTSKENLRGGVWKAADGIMQTYGSFDLSCTFRNYLGNPIFSLIYYWMLYISSVVDGVMVPYPDMLAANEIDYNTRIYRLILDETRTYVKMIACCGAAFPTSIDLGRFFNLNETNENVTEHNEISVTFTCVGACYLNNIIVDEFNKTVCIGVPAMNKVRLLRFASGTSDEDLYKIDSNFGYEKVPRDLLYYFNHRCIPFINTNTLELEWWINKDSYSYQQFKYMLGFTEKSNAERYKGVPPTPEVEDDQKRKDIDNEERKKFLEEQKFGGIFKN